MPLHKLSLSLILTILAVSTLQAQEPPKPTEGHKVLHQEVGRWKAAIKMWMPGQDEAQEASGVETTKMLGGMWAVSTFKGEFFGEAFEGRANLGYDPHNKKYVGSWVDSMEPYMSKMEGTWDAKTKTMTLMTTGVDPESGKERKGKNVTVYKDKNTRIMTMYMQTGPGEYVKSMEIKYTRDVRAKTDKKPRKKGGAKKGAAKTDAAKTDAPKKDAK